MIDTEQKLKLIMNSALEAAMPKDKFKLLPAKPEGKLIVLGAGKAAASMAAEFEKVYNHSLEGMVITRYGHYTKTKVIKVLEASHPKPDQASLEATKILFNLAKNAKKEDHIVFLISGGASSLLTLPLDGVSFEEKQRINSELLISGAAIDKMNVVRRSLSQIKGGRLAEAIYPAQMTTYMISDIPGDDPAYIGSGPTIQAIGRNEDAISILNDYKIRISKQVEKIILSNTLPKLITSPQHMLATPMMALKNAAKIAKKQGYIPIILSDSLEGEASIEGKKMAELAISIKKNKKYNNINLEKPILLLSGGETTVTVKGKGKGGRNSEFILSMAITLNSIKGIDALAIDTDGIDGIEDNAGAYISSKTLEKARLNNLDPIDYLKNNNSYSFFRAIKDLIYTSPTLTNVNDFRAVLIQP
jgi:glycerate 2-kinase|tara:strand:- start:762 stop:2012 length:1251 start_codon:yes stop_codon:yes gene_type:complete